MAQPVKNLPVMPETWVRSLCWENPLEKGKDPYLLDWAALNPIEVPRETLLVQKD